MPSTPAPEEVAAASAPVAVLAAAGTRRPLVLASLMVAMSLAAIEGTIVATAMPSIVAGLGGFEVYGWVFASYLLTQAVSTPIYGALADTFGRKGVLLFGVAVFLVGSVLCGFATSMTMLVLFRLVQGLGAGAIYPMVATLAGDLYSVRERGRIQAYLSSVWGVSAVLGPLAGAAAVGSVGWPWVFWFSVPFGLLAMAGIARYLHEEVAQRRRVVDYRGALLVFLTIGTWMLALTQGAALGWSRSLVLAAAGGACLGAYVLHARRAAEPLIPLAPLRDRLVLVANLATFTAGVMMIGLVANVPTYVQGVLGRPPLVAGFALTTMSIGWPLASLLAGRVLVPWGPSRTARIGGALLVVGGLALLAVTPERSPLWIAGASFIVGSGFGFVLTTMIVSIQSTVGWGERGAATATNMLMRVLGNALGAAIFGTALTIGVRRALAAAGEGAPSLAELRPLLDPAARAVEGGAAVGPSTAAAASALAAGLQGVFALMLACALLTLALTWLLPRRSLV